MNVEENLSTNASDRKIKKIVRSLHPSEKIHKLKEESQKEQSYIIFRLKRSAKVEPIDILAIDNLELSSVIKKHQANSILSLEDSMNSLSIKMNENKAANTVDQQELSKFREGLLYFENKTELKLVLKRIDPSSIFDLAKDEEEFRKSYKTVYNEVLSKEKREAKLKERRQVMFEKLLTSQKYKVYDANIKKDTNQLLCNGKPMLVQNLLEISKNKEEKRGDIEEEETEYDYLRLEKTSHDKVQTAPRITVDDFLKESLTGHLAVGDVDLVHDDQYRDNEEMMKKENDDEYDSNSENNSQNDYPDIEMEDLEGSDGEKESDFGDYEEEEDGDDENRFDRVEDSFKEDFYKKIKNMADENFKWPTRSAYLE